MSSDCNKGNTKGNPSKRLRLSSYTEKDDCDPGNVRNSSSNLIQSPVSTGRTPGQSSDREECRYKSNCYRRNESHLIQYRHQLLEEAYRLMTESSDFTKFPDSLDIGDGDRDVILEQATILKEAGFRVQLSGNSAHHKPQPTLNSESTRNEHRIQNTKPSSSSSVVQNEEIAAIAVNPRNNDPVTELFEERRRRMREKQLASEKVKALPTTRPVSSTNKSIGSNANMAAKWEASCPFNIFLTKVRDVPVEKEGVFSTSFTDLFDSSFGEIKALCHINFMIEANWLFEQTIHAGLEGKPTRIIYGEENKELEEGANAFPWLKLFKEKSPFPFGHHHTKMSFVQYTDNSVRFFVYTANLVESDWDNRTQGVWISPKCPKVPSGSPPAFGESATGFRKDIMEYLTTYPTQATAAWRDVIKYTDCSSIKTYFVASAPITSQSHLNGFQFGIKKMEKILKSHEMETEPNWHLMVQCSSIGTLGGSANDWLVGEFGGALSGKDRCLQGPVNLVYPSNQNVKSSFDGVLGGGCLPYSAMTHMKQRWLDRHMYQWKAECSGRSRAPPHIKSYSRWSPDQTKMAWFLLTSANLSKAAWGKLSKHGDRLTVMSWEAGVLFIPELICSANYFTVCGGDKNTESNKFPLYYDVPLVKYEKKDHPWFFETLQLAISE